MVGTFDEAQSKGIQHLAKLNTLEIAFKCPKGLYASQWVREDLVVFVPLAQLTDPSKELARLEKLILERTKAIDLLKAQLSKRKLCGKGIVFTSGREAPTTGRATKRARPPSEKKADFDNFVF